MTNKSKAIGTRCETLAVNYAQAHGFPFADRITLHGLLDEGDIQLCPGLIAQVKGGLAAEQASDAQVMKWLNETDDQRVNRKADVAFLVVKRKGHGATKVGGWWAVDWIELGARLPAVARFRLDEYLLGLRADGWGDPLEPES